MGAETGAAMSPCRAVQIVGVGPGDPGLLTLRAADAIRGCDVLYHPGPRDDAGFAFEIVSGLIRPGQAVRGMAPVMRRGPSDDVSDYDRIARALADDARAGRRAAFLTEGDPMLYGTGSHVLDRLRVVAPELAAEVVPGVCAFTAAAARLGWPLARKREILTVCPGTYHAGEIGPLLDRGGPSCWLKAADVLPRLVEELRLRGRLDRAALVERLGRPDERIVTDLAGALHLELSYFSLVLIRC